jgi:hypothetical protein
LVFGLWSLIFDLWVVARRDLARSCVLFPRLAVHVLPEGVDPDNPHLCLFALPLPAWCAQNLGQRLKKAQKTAWCCQKLIAMQETKKPKPKAKLGALTLRQHLTKVVMMVEAPMTVVPGQVVPGVPVVPGVLVVVYRWTTMMVLVVLVVLAVQVVVYRWTTMLAAEVPVEVAQAVLAAMVAAEVVVQGVQGVTGVTVVVQVATAALAQMHPPMNLLVRWTQDRPDFVPIGSDVRVAKIQLRKQVVKELWAALGWLRTIFAQTPTSFPPPKPLKLKPLPANRATSHTSHAQKRISVYHLDSSAMVVFLIVKMGQMKIGRCAGTVHMCWFAGLFAL